MPYGGNRPWLCAILWTICRCCRSSSSSRHRRRSPPIATAPFRARGRDAHPCLGNRGSFAGLHIGLRARRGALSYERILAEHTAGCFLVRFFDLDDSKITHQAALILDNAIFVWRDQLPPECPIQVEGYTDTSGSAEHNLALSRRRAEAVAAYLRQHGVNSAIRTKAYGETHLLVETPDGVREPQNRRAFIIVTPNP